MARSSLGGGTWGTPFLLQIFCLFGRYVTVFDDYFLLGHLLDYDFDSVSKKFLGTELAQLK